jgi:diaminohydroxyphosphoribosylaminopyrimidine deaminase/5-amino-6-(5-phosphoribosylamino)uracil reductase
MTGPEARAEVHRLRAANDGVLVGIGTALADDPQLTVRDAGGTSPIRVVLDSQGRLPASARMLATPGRTIVYVGEDAPPERLKRLADRAEVVRLGRGPRLPIAAVLEDLGRREVTSLLVEGGATVHGELFDKGLVDSVAVFVAPLVLGGSAAPPGVAGLGAESPAAGLRLAGGRWQVLGEDAYFTAVVERRSS